MRQGGASGLAFAPEGGARRGARRGAGLAPMIDVVFLLLVFFMLAARLGAEAGLVLRLAPPQGAAGAPTAPAWQGPPRLVELRGGGRILLNGVPLALEALPAALSPLMPAAGAPVVLRAGPGVDLQRLLDVAGALRLAGFSGVVIAP